MKCHLCSVKLGRLTASLKVERESLDFCTDIESCWVDKDKDKVFEIVEICPDCYIARRVY